jgi:restriction endonuclease S subunit
LEGLEISIVSYASLQNGVETLRFDSEYYLKEYVRIEKFINNNKLLFNRFSDWQIDIDCSAFYPAIEPFYGEGNIPLIRVQNVKDIIDYNKCVCIPQLSNEQFATLKTVIPGDIVITKGGSIGLIGYITQEAYACRDLIFIKSSTLLEEQRVFLYLYLTTDFVYKQLIRSSSQCAQPHLTITLVKNLDIFNGSSMLMQKCTKIYSDFRQKYLASLDLYREAEELLLSELQIPDLVQQSNNVIYCRYSDFMNSGRLDAEYYQPKYNEIIDKIQQYPDGHDKIGNLYILRDKNFLPEDNVRYKYIELSDIEANGEISGYTYEYGSNLPSRARRIVHTGDIIISSIEGSLQNCAVITEEYDGALCSTGFYVLSPQIINSETSLVLFKSSAIQALLKRACTGTILTAINKDEFTVIDLPAINRDVQNKIADIIHQSIALRKESRRLLNLAKTAVETAIERDEDVAMKLLDIGE